MGNETYQHSLAKGKLPSKVISVATGRWALSIAHDGDMSCERLVRQRDQPPAVGGADV